MDLSMKMIGFLLSFLLLLPLGAQARSSQSLILSGRVPERLDYHLQYDGTKKVWRIQQSSNARLKAVLVKAAATAYVVSIRAP